MDTTSFSIVSFLVSSSRETFVKENRMFFAGGGVITVESVTSRTKSLKTIFFFIGAA